MLPSQSVKTFHRLIPKHSQSQEYVIVKTLLQRVSLITVYAEPKIGLSKEQEMKTTCILNTANR